MSLFKQLKPVNSVDHKRRGSLVSTPDRSIDHQSKQMSVPAGTQPLFSLDDFGESSNYLEANDSSATNSSCSFDAPPACSPPVPPRIVNPPPRSTRMAANEHLIDTNINIDTAPIPAARAKSSKAQMNTNHAMDLIATALPPIQDRINTFENSFVSNINSLNMQKNVNGVRARPPHIDPPPKSINHKANMTNATKMSEVRRIPSKMLAYPFYTINIPPPV